MNIGSICNTEEVYRNTGPSIDEATTPWINPVCDSKTFYFKNRYINIYIYTYIYMSKKLPIKDSNISIT